MELIPHCLTPNDHLRAFVVWLSLVCLRTLAHPEPYLPKTSVEAVPQYISGRTSYLQVRLAFHPYPQLIPAFCTRHGFGPPLGDYPSFNLAMGSSPGFGSNPYNFPGMLEFQSPAPKINGAVPTNRNIVVSVLGRQYQFRPVNALFRLAFASAPELIFLNQLHKLTHRLILQ